MIRQRLERAYNLDFDAESIPFDGFVFTNTLGQHEQANGTEDFRLEDGEILKVHVTLERALDCIQHGQHLPT